MMQLPDTRNSIVNEFAAGWVTRHRAQNYERRFCVADGDKAPFGARFCDNVKGNCKTVGNYSSTLHGIEGVDKNKVTICCCDSDNCNQGARHLGSVVAALLSLLVAAVVFAF